MVSPVMALGIDVGAVSVKIALLIPADRHEEIEQLQKNCAPYIHTVDRNVFSSTLNAVLVLTTYQRTLGEPKTAIDQLLRPILQQCPGDLPLAISTTGSVGKGIAQHLQVSHLNEFQAVAVAMHTLHPEIRTVLEIGGDTSKYILLDPLSSNGAVGIQDYEINGDCAAGTGSFIDQQASRLLFSSESVGEVVLEAERAASIAGRCSVFAKSDMIHAQQKGFQPPEILKGLCESVVRNYKGAVIKSKPIIPPVAFIGGVAANKGIVQAMRSVLALPDGALEVPQYYHWMEAIGAAIQADRQRKYLREPMTIARTFRNKSAGNGTISATRPLSTEKLVLLRDRVEAVVLPDDGSVVACYLGIDIGSVSTKLVLIDEQGQVIKAIYTRTEGRPIEVVGRGLREIERELGDRIQVIGVCTTGSGRELIGGLIGADVIKDEITAHKTGATFISQAMTGRPVDTIFDIGGQDSKYISIENGIVVDFTMNEACAAGTGSFLEEQAEKLGISIRGEFAKLALSSGQPVRLGERCTVFMEKDVTQYLQQGVAKQHITAGLAYSIVHNYLNRVVRGRHIGKTIYFQGGTAYNDAVAAAFATVLNQDVIVPPHNGVIGAIGAALLAKEKIIATGRKTSFRGFAIDRIDYQLRSFTCKACTNYCDIQQFTVEGEKTYWGDKCSEKYRSASRVERQASIPDLLRFRDELYAGIEKQSYDSNSTPVIGYPRAMYYYNQFPFWQTYFSRLGLKLVLSDETNKSIIHAGTESKVAEPCFPIEVAHGHVDNLISKGVDYLFIPNVINMPTNFPEVNSFLCPWGQTLCLVIRETPAFAAYRDKLLYPNVRFAEGIANVKRSLRKMAKKLGRSTRVSDDAVEHAYASQQEFDQALLARGKEMLSRLQQSGEPAIVLIGRPYNIYDRMINLNIPGKLRENYGVNIIPVDFLADDSIDISDVTDNMFWNFGRKILQVAKLTRDYPNLHLIYITNFKCGPDSYIKHYVRVAGRKPFLTLQMDGHGNDAGIITRCEAYLDSKGFFQ